MAGLPTPPLSVVLAYRNARPWLARCLHSLAAERDLPFELVAVDDGSTDGGPAWLEHLCRFWPPGSLQTLHTPGLGVSAARNHGVRHARAPLIAFLDADDRCLPGRLHQPLALLQRQPQLSQAMGGWQRINALGAPLASVCPWQERAGFSLEAALLHKAVLPSAWTLRREAFLAVGGFDPQLSHAEDVDLLLKLASAGAQGAWVEQPLCRYRVHPSAASRALLPQIESLSAVTERHLARLPAEQQPLARNVRYATLCWCSWRAWAAGDQRLALEWLQRALRHCPLPLPRRPVHFLENMARSCQRDGLPWSLQAVLASPFWQQASTLLLEAR